MENVTNKVYCNVKFVLLHFIYFVQTVAKKMFAMIFLYNLKQRPTYNAVL